MSNLFGLDEIQLGLDSEPGGGVQVCTGDYYSSNPSSQPEYSEKELEEFRQQMCEHEACNTGTRHTWCKKCNVDMEIVDGFAVARPRARPRRQDDSGGDAGGREYPYTRFV